MTSPKPSERHPATSPARSDARTLNLVAMHGVIGKYITRFSEIVHYMRVAISDLVSVRDGQRHEANPLLNAIFDRMTADPIQAAFFAICAEVGDYTDADRTIRRTLQEEVRDHIRLRNDIAHADWFVGYTDENDELLPFSAERIRTSKDGIAVESLPFTMEQLEDEADFLRDVHLVVRLFGMSALSHHSGKTQMRPSTCLEIFKGPDGRRRVRCNPYMQMVMDHWKGTTTTEDIGKKLDDDDAFAVWFRSLEF